LCRFPADLKRKVFVRTDEGLGAVGSASFRLAA
jgi:hypothetical protein